MNVRFSERAGLATKSVLIIHLGWVSSHPRVLRQIRSLAPKARVTVIGFGPLSIPGIEYLELSGFSKKQPGQLSRFRFSTRLIRGLSAFSGLFQLTYWVFTPSVRAARKLTRGRSFDVILANEIESIPLALRIARPKNIVVDLHDYFPGQLQRFSPANLSYARYRRWLCTKYLAVPSRLISSGSGLTSLYEERWGVRIDATVRNTPNFEALTPSQVSNDRIELVYHGLAGYGRGLEELLGSMPALPDVFRLNLVITGDLQPALQRLSSKLGIEHRVIFHDPVATPEIPRFINRFDVGVVFHTPITENLANPLPNKFFESIQGRLALVVGPSREMSEIVRRYQIGKVCEGFSQESLTHTLKELSPEEVREMKSRSTAAAKTLSWESEEEAFLATMKI